MKLDKGLPQGSITYSGKSNYKGLQIKLISYHSSMYEEIKLSETSSFNIEDLHDNTWVNIIGLSQTKEISKIGALLNIHNLSLEDIVNTEHRPKFEELNDYLLCIVKMIRLDKDRLQLIEEQLSMVLTENCLISFQEQEGDAFAAIRQRLTLKGTRLRDKGIDHLFCALIDAIVDEYFQIFDRLRERLVELEMIVVKDPAPEILQKIQIERNNLLKLGHSIFPMREILNQLQKNESGLLKEDTNKYFRDVYDNILHILDQYESLRDMSSDVKELYITTINLKTNRNMEVLTIVSTIFIPLTFIVGVYGMNFDYMPETKWDHGYLMVWILMIIMVIFQLYYFYRKKWL